MSFFVPEALSIFSSAGAALQALIDWRKRSREMPGQLTEEEVQAIFFDDRKF